jgi:hypothetical protein
MFAVVPNGVAVSEERRMHDGPTPWFIVRRRLDVAHRRALLVALAIALASSASAVGAVRSDKATPAAAIAGAGSEACAPVVRSVGFALVPDHSRQLPAPSPVPLAGDTAACRRLHSLVPRREPLPPGR